MNNKRMTPRKMIKKLFHINNRILLNNLFMKVEIMSNLAKNTPFMIEHQDNYQLLKIIII